MATTEAERIARFIRSEVDAGRRTYGDFLILTRKKKNRLIPYVQALEALQIPMEVSGAGAFAESREVKALALLLRALSDPQDSVSLVGVLRGPLFGVSDRELFAFKQAGGWFSIFCEVGQASSAWRQGGARRVRARVVAPVSPLDARASSARGSGAHARAHGLPRAGDHDPGRRRSRRPGACRRPRASGDGKRRQPCGSGRRRSRPTPRPPAISSLSRSSLAGRPSSAS